MKILLYIGVVILIGLVAWGIGAFFGTWFAKKQKLQNEVRRNGSKHV